MSMNDSKRPYDTRIADLHRETNIPTIRKFVDEITEKFDQRALSHENNLVRN